MAVLDRTVRGASATCDRYLFGGVPLDGRREGHIVDHRSRRELNELSEIGANNPANK
jgi:hypothetical protein